MFGGSLIGLVFLPATDLVDGLRPNGDKCVNKLIKWNKNFAHVGIEIRKLEEILRGQQDAISRRHTLRLIRETLVAMSSFRLSEVWGCQH